MKDHFLPKISVIIPVYNRLELLKRAVNSVLTQTYINFEIIIINDGSTDKALYDIEFCPDPRIKLIHHETNQGVSAARNTGILASSGEYIALLDSDDEWFPLKLEKQLQKVQMTDNILDHTCVTGYILNRGILCRNDEQSSELNQRAGAKQLLQGCFLSPGSTLMAHRAIFERVGLFDTTLTRCEDWDWLLRHAQEGLKILSVHEALAKVNIQSKPTMEMIKKPLQVLEQKYKKGLSFKEAMIFRSTLFLELSSASFYEKKYAGSLILFICCMVFYPFRTFQFFKKVLRNSLLFLTRNFPIVAEKK